MNGTVLTAFKAAYIGLLTSYLTTVSYGSPIDPEQIEGADGSGLALWWDDDAVGSLDITVMAGGGPVNVDETWHATLVIQAWSRDTDDTQQVVDGRASEALYYAIGILAGDPSVGVVDTSELQLFAAVPVGEIANPTGVLGGSARVSRFNVPIEITGRLKIVI